MTSGATQPAPRERILEAALELLEEGGAEAVSTRAVGARAGVQAPAIYRLFGDKEGLLQAAVERGYGRWVAAKGDRAPEEDPVDELRAGWRDAIGFGLDHPALYRIASARLAESPATAAGRAALGEKIDRVAAAGRLRIGREQALALVQAAGRGTTLALLDLPPQQRATDPLATTALEAVVAAVTTDAPQAHDGSVRGAAAALQALLPRTAALGPAERALMAEWLERIAAAQEDGPG